MELTATSFTRLSENVRSRIESEIRRCGLICNGGSCVQMSDGSRMLSISINHFDGRPVDSAVQLKNKITRILEEESGWLNFRVVLN